MARYIDADALYIYFDACIKHAEMEGLYNIANVYERCLRIVKNAPTADVAPMAEVAREIFEEIQKMLDRCWLMDDYGMTDMMIDVAELKKKYTEPEPPEGD